MFSRPGNYWKFLEYLILTLVCFLLQSVPAFGVRFLGCAPSLLLLLTVGVAFFESPAFAAWFGLAMGILSELTTSTIVGLDGILFMFIGFFTAVALELVLQRQFFVYLSICLGGVAVQQLLQYLYRVLIWDSVPFGIAFINRILPIFLFTGLCAFPLYGILRHYDRKFREQEGLV